MGILDWIKNKQEEKNKVKEEENELRRQVESEVSEEVIKIKKDKIKEEILSEVYFQELNRIGCPVYYCEPPIRKYAQCYQLPSGSDKRKRD